ncbi:hypothetical protein G9A89_010994 [Geosiphon pyriformis]|nr:hypothetical protein G9A89_010994 [Geosiphon pyriformis]
MTKTKSKKAAPNICSKISNKISTKKAFFVVKATRQNVLEAFFLPSNRNKLFLVTTEATFLFLAGFSPVKVPSKRHTWVSPSVVFTPTKSPKVFNNRPVNKLVFSFMASTSGTASTFSSKKMVKKTKSSENIIQHVIQDRPRSTTGCVAKCGLSVLENWADQMETELFSLLVSGATFGGAWETITMASVLVLSAIFKIKLAYIKTVFQLVHGFLGAKLVLKDNMKLFCVEFASHVSLETVFLVKLTSSVHLATLKIAKFLVVSESGSLSAVVVLCNMLLDMSTANIKTALSVFGVITHVMLKSTGIWQYIVVHFKNLVAAVSAFNYWSVLVGKDSI